jgi:hypothetical protein
LKRPQTPAEHLACWVTLVAQAERCARNPMLATLDLEKACERAHVALLPAGECVRDNPFMVLLDLARRFAGETMLARAGMATELAAALETAASLRRLETGRTWAEAYEPPPPPFRADIDG